MSVTDCDCLDHGIECHVFESLERRDQRAAALADHIHPVAHVINHPKEGERVEHARVTLQ